MLSFSILASKLPVAQQQRARVVGLSMAVGSRILLLFSLSWIIGLSAPLFSIIGYQISGRDLILILGGLFLLAKSTYEIHQKLEGVEGHTSTRVRATFASVIVQVLLLVIWLHLCTLIVHVFHQNG
jgi:predicted tellurium resistance membrane protein TerC